MRPASPAQPGVVGIFFFMLAGLSLGAGEDSIDRDLWLAAHYGLLACWILGLVVGGIAIGTRASRD